MQSALDQYAEAVAELKNARAHLNQLALKLSVIAEQIGKQTEQLAVPGATISASYASQITQLKPLPSQAEIESAVATHQRLRVQVHELFHALTPNQQASVQPPTQVGAGVL